MQFAAIYINALSFEKGKYFKAMVDGYMQKKKFKSRIEALIYAIEKADELYNRKVSQPYS